MTQPLFALGFRPFYLVAVVFGFVSVGMWNAFYSGWLTLPGDLPVMLWHSHEMAFGFAPAVIAGFLLTAVRNWTGMPTPTGGWLALLVLIWLTGRLAVIGAAPVAALVDLLFLPALALAIGLPIFKSGNRRNVKVVALIIGLALCNLLFHVSRLRGLGLEQVAVIAAVDLIMILLVLIGGRVIPAFTSNAVAEADPRHNRVVEILAFATLLGVLGLDLAGNPLPAPVIVGTLLAAAVVQVGRLALWQPLRTRGQPLLWMMPMAYLWIPIALALRAAASAGMAVSPTAGIHAFTIGAMTGLMLAMMMRSALGHTGRALVAGPVEIASFALVQLAAVTRVLLPMLWPEAQVWAVGGATALWSVALAIFATRYLPMLVRVRIDGKPG